MLKIYNTLTNKKKIFKPINSKNISIYVCGMTVYDYCHIGHARILVIFDVITRHLRNSFSKVTYIRNITDIDDKIINKAIENKEDIYILTERFITAMHEDEKSLETLSPDLEPRATQHIEQMLLMIKNLIDNGLAYQTTNGDIYYAIRKFKKYGKLSGKNIQNLTAGARVDIEKEKKDPLDFVLWKAAKAGEPKWPSPWGEGRPGWHIECSAMSTHHLGDNFDIHGGGADLTFPHHENEIAQSEGANKCNFVNTWMHVGFVNFNNEKMSKSLNNFFTIRDVLNNYEGEIIRYFIISSHYRSPLNFSEENLKKAKSALTRLYQAIKGLEDKEIIESENYKKYHIHYQDIFKNALDDDFNTPIALSILFEIAKKINNTRKDDLNKAKELTLIIKKLSSTLGILQNNAEKFLKSKTIISIDEIERKIHQREQARKSKDFALSDKIRKELEAVDIMLEDNPHGTTWRKK